MMVSARAGSTCHAPDFDSYHKARNLKETLLKETPDLNHPNFGDRFLILKASLMMETLNFIVDCETGKIFHTSLTGEAHFKADSSVLELKTKEGSELQRWSGTDFVRVENEKQTSQTSQAEPSDNPVFAAHGVAFESTPCKPLDYSSYFRASTAKGNLERLKTPIAQANFGGHYLLLKNELIFETLWLIADCQTGKFIPEYLSAKDAVFKKDSTSLMIKNTGAFPRFYHFALNQWIEIPDLSRSEHPSVSNDWRGKETEILTQVIPNPEHYSLLNFEGLKCALSLGSQKPSCELKGASPFSIEISQKLLPIVQAYGASSSEGKATSPSYLIKSGKCIPEKKICTFETQ